MTDPSMFLCPVPVIRAALCAVLFSGLVFAVCISIRQFARFGH